MLMHRNTMRHALYAVCAAFLVGTSPALAEDENGLSLLLPPEMRKSLAEARFDPTRLPARLVDWPVFEWTINARAACGVGLSKFGLLVSVKDQGPEGNAMVRRILSRGAAGPGAAAGGSRGDRGLHAAGDDL